jgi:hypothetical protein
MGQLDVHIRHSGGCFDLGEVIQVAVIAGVAIGVAVIIAEFAWLIITLGVIAVAARLYLHYRRTVAIRAIAAQGERVRAEQAALEAAALERRMRHEIEVAKAGATVIQNIIDPAAITASVAAALTRAQQQPCPRPVRVIRGGVER